jgi:hypothetical protein
MAIMAKTDGGIPDFCDKNYHSLRSELINAWRYASLVFGGGTKTMKLELSENAIKELKDAIDNSSKEDKKRTITLVVVDPSDYNTFDKKYVINQIFHEVSPGVQLSISTQRCLGRYYFNSDDLIVGERYVIDDIKYRCRLKCSSYIELEEA